MTDLGIEAEEARQFAQEMRAEGQTVMFVAHEGALLGLIGVADLDAAGWLYDEGSAVCYDRARALFPEDLQTWLEATQPQAWEALTKAHGHAAIDVLCDRLRGFQAGPYACKANACALTHLEEAQHWLQQRTIERMRRGVEGTHTV